MNFANSAERALQIMEQQETGVVISETNAGRSDLTGLLKALKLHHPHIATVVLTERANAQTVIELINEGQVYRMLIKPVRMGTCRLSVDSAIGRYWQLKQNPQAARRYTASAPRGWRTASIDNKSARGACSIASVHCPAACSAPQDLGEEPKRRRRSPRAFRRTRRCAIASPRVEAQSADDSIRHFRETLFRRLRTESRSDSRRLRSHFSDRERMLEIGSGTGQHAAYFAAKLPMLNLANIGSRRESAEHACVAR